MVSRAVHPARSCRVLTPSREIVLNSTSLVFGFTGNLFLLLNFTGRVRYIVALPMSIVFWTLASSIVSCGTSVRLG